MLSVRTRSLRAAALACRASGRPVYARGYASEGKKPQPKILNHRPPAKGEEPPDVAAHNREMEKRADKAHAAADADAVKNKGEDKVDKEFWKGQGGVDREP